METYDDVLQFLEKTGSQEVNYQKFQTSTYQSGSSRWKMVNQVASFEKNTPQPLLYAAQNSVVTPSAIVAETQSTSPSEIALKSLPLQAKELEQASHSLPFFLSAKPVQQEQEQQEQAGSSLSALFKRISK